MSTDHQTLRQVTAELSTRPTALQIAKAIKVLSALETSAAGLKPLRLAVVSSFTFDLLVNPLIARGYCDGIRLDVYNAPYGQFVQELINPRSALAAHKPDVVLIAVRLADVCSELVNGFASLSEDRVAAIVNRWKSELEQALRTFRQSSQARILCTNYEQPAFPSLGLADHDAAPSQAATIAALNGWLHKLSDRIGSMHIVDIDGLAARCGRARFIDSRMALLARQPIAADCQWEYVGEITRVLRAMNGLTKKVLVLDCDNTLWGGVLGDVGRDGIQLGHDYPGSAYVALQQRALELFHRGVVLVVASKNEKRNVLDVFQNHAEMVLRPQHIAYFAVNWDPKPGNLRQAAGVLNLGLDSFVFLDDHPVECAMMRELAPEVLTIQMPEDPARYELTLARLDCFDQLTLSEEDRRRGALYREEAARAELKAEATDLESFYRSLDMTAYIACDDAAQVGRIAQMTQRTNQFNMTTVRRTESEILELMKRPDAEVVALRLNDRFGDNGIIGLAIVENRGDEHVLETFLMSCRVLGRTVEDLFIGWLAARARSAGAARLTGLYAKTKKNEPFGGFYPTRGFVPDGLDKGGAERYVYVLSPDAALLKLPAWIKLEVAEPETV